ncbi:VOC family protein [Actinoplanes subtropicus]|uniref:VOC family protein n=1 Tax=Actinoplanes subtropicus TaxID=543632 RepID=UPI0004C2EB24|nr:VOC family protein [Actinoplanes subtropicus]
MAQLGSVFLPVTSPRDAAAWYSAVFGLAVSSVQEHAAVLDSPDREFRLTLMGPGSGIAARPGLTWAAFSLLVGDLEAARKSLADRDPGPISGDEHTCLWFTTTDPDGNTLLICDR